MSPSAAPSALKRGTSTMSDQSAPIGEPEISREDYRAQILSAVIGVLDQWHDGLRERKAVEIADAILNLAPVGADPMDLPPAEQFALATKLAANVGYELTPEPEHPDSPHARHPVGGRGEEGSARADLSSASRSQDQHSAGGEAKVYWAIRRVPDGYVEPQLYKFKDTAEAAASKRRRYQAFPLVPQEQGGMK